MEQAHKDRLKHWAEVLRSGKYTQTAETLRRAVDREDGNEQKTKGHCCLGVGCEIYRKETGEGKWLKRKSNGIYEDIIFVFSLPGKGTEESFLPMKIMEWFGIDDETQRLLAGLNDFSCRRYEGGLGVNYFEIANIIDELAME